MLNARLTDVKGICKGEIGHKTLTATAHAEFLVTRGPAAQSREVDLQYNVVVVQRGSILDAKQYTQRVTFPPNVDLLQVTGQAIPFQFNTERGLTGPSYEIYFVLQLTPQELAANQQALQRPDARVVPGRAAPAGRVIRGDGSMRVLVIGAEIIGTIFGWALQRGGHAVEHYVRPGRAARLAGGVELDVLDTRKGGARFRGAYVPHAANRWRVNPASI